MNNQPPIIVNSAPPVPPPRPKINPVLILTVFLGLGTIGFGLASITAFSRAHTATATLESAKATAAAQAKDAQKQADAKAAETAAESPYRSYNAPDAYGAFVINFPKNWNMTVDQEEGDSTQVSLVLNPDFIRRVNGTDDLTATKIQLIQKTSGDFLKQFTAKTIVTTHITVSGLPSVQLTGTLPDKRMTRLVAVPVRDKTLVFINENSAFASTFDTILAQAKINP